MNLSVFARIIVSVVAAGLLASCAVVTSQPTASPFATATASAPPMVPPTPTAPTTPTIEPTLTPPPRTDPPPPRGILTADDTAVEGWLGSYCWRAICADAPGAPPKEQLPLISGDSSKIEFSLTGGATFHIWRATYARESGASPTPLGQGGAGFDPDALPSAAPDWLSTVEFASPPRGEWVVFVQVFLAEGDLSYAWHVIVP